MDILSSYKNYIAYIMYACVYLYVCKCMCSLYVLIILKIHQQLQITARDSTKFIIKIASVSGESLMNVPTSNAFLGFIFTTDI